MARKEFTLDTAEEAKALFGAHDDNLTFIEQEMGVSLFARDRHLVIEGEDAACAMTGKLIGELLITIRHGLPVRRHEVRYAITSIRNGARTDVHNIYLDKIEVSSKRQYVTPKSRGQKAYVDSIRENDIVFGIGPAGTGKTYLAMAMAVNALRKQIVSRIILARPAVEAGENLGFLPGDLNAKVSPYLRPLYDALYDMVEVNNIQTYIDRGIIEVVPLAYMRGRTLNNSFIVLDEAQNSTPEQMKMFLTRLGFDSKTVITGDITQSDLPHGQESGLIQVTRILEGIPGISFVRLSGEDVVRHELVLDIIRAYEGARKRETQ